MGGAGMAAEGCLATLSCAFCLLLTHRHLPSVKTSPSQWPWPFISVAVGDSSLQFFQYRASLIAHGHHSPNLLHFNNLTFSPAPLVLGLVAASFSHGHHDTFMYSSSFQHLVNCSVY